MSQSNLSEGQSQSSDHEYAKRGAGESSTSSQGGLSEQTNVDRTFIRVLMVEDNPLDYDLFNEYLSLVDTVDFEVQHCETSSDAVSLLNSGADFSVILLDLTLPDTSGLESFTVMKGVARNIPIVVLTGIEDRTLSVQALEFGAANYLLKQKISPDRIATALMSAVRRRG